MTQTRTYDTFVLFEPHNKPLMHSNGGKLGLARGVQKCQVTWLIARVNLRNTPAIEFPARFSNAVFHVAIYQSFHGIRIYAKVSHIFSVQLNSSQTPFRDFLTIMMGVLFEVMILITMVLTMKMVMIILLYQVFRAIPCCNLRKSGSCLFPPPSLVMLSFARNLRKSGRYTLIICGIVICLESCETPLMLKQANSADDTKTSTLPLFFAAYNLCHTDLESPQGKSYFVSTTTENIANLKYPVFLTCPVKVHACQRRL